MGYFAYGEPGLETPPASNFTAVANWGDGTTSPASVSRLSVGDCYGASTQGHLYSSTGTYPFSYTVHDAETGQDHTLTATELHIWSLVPHLLGDASSHTIRPTVGTLWSGVLGEFAYEGTVTPSYPYSAQIEWGDGESTQGAIVLQSNNTFGVSGSLTYTRSFSGTITVLLWHGTQLLGRWTTSSVDAQETPTHDRQPTPVRFRGQPILAVIPSPTGAPVYELVFRTNQPLPRTSSGRVEALIESHGRTNPVGSLVAHRASTCYVAHISVIKLKPGSRYPFTLSIDSGSVTRYGGHASLRKFASLDRMRSIASKQLGCTQQR